MIKTIVFLFCATFIAGCKNYSSNEYISTQDSFQSRNSPAPLKNESTKNSISLTQPPPQWTPTKTVVIARDIGFFSIFNEFMSYLVFELESNNKNRVFPDWHASSITRVWNHFVYGTDEDKNIWLKLFQPINYNDLESNNTEIYNNKISLYDSANIAPLDGYFHPDTFSISEDERNRLYHSYFNKYIKLQPNIEKIVNDFTKENFEGFSVIAVHSRLHFHKKIHPEAYHIINFTMDTYIEKINEIIKEYSIDVDKLKIFLATDNEKSIDFFENEFPGKICYQKDVLRLSKEIQESLESQMSTMNKSEQIELISKSEAHSYAGNKEINSSVKNAQDVFIDAYLMSKANYWIGGPSGLTWAVFYMNPNIIKYRIDYP